MARIQVLDKHTAELIAAGEVVERPSSVIKEMAENAIDAGATRITVEINNGGITYIRITDDGAGISREDVPTAFLRHATSKISREDDLQAIATLGFRGEALASIAAVARVDLLTKTKEEACGTHYVIEGGEEVLLDDAGCPDGTTFVIRDLFYNTPARMKFLKKNVAEGNAVADVVDRLALSHPEISFRLLRDGRQTLQTPGNGDLHAAIYAVYGKEFAESLIPVQYENGAIRLSGFTCKPVAARKNRSMQLFFINGRFVKTGTGSAALQEAYKNAIMVGKFPAGVYHLQFPFREIDVNVHPAKIEVRFSNERAIFDTVYYGVRSALEAGDTRPVLHLPDLLQQTVAAAQENTRFKKASSAFQKPLSQTAKTPSVQGVQTKFRMQTPMPALPQEHVLEDSTAAVHATLNQWPGQARYDAPPPAPKPAARQPAPVKPATPPVAAVQEEADEAPTVRLIGEAFHTYVLAEVGNRILLIDKHAAHERILFDALRAHAAESPQMLLEPVSLTLRKQEYSLLVDNLALLEKAGILLEPFGEDAVLVRAVPMNLTGEDVSGLLEEIVEKLSSGYASVTADRLDWLYHSIACRAAVKGGDKTDPLQLLTLARRIAQDDAVRYCPHGRPVAIWLTRYQLEKQFGRSDT